MVGTSGLAASVPVASKTKGRYSFPRGCVMEVSGSARSRFFSL